LIVDDGLAQITKLGFTDYLNNLVYPIRYSNVFGGAFDLKDDLSGFPPFLNGYSSTYGDAFYKMGIESNKAILQVNGGVLTSNSNIKLTENELQFTEGGNTTSIKTNPTGNSASYFLPANNGTDQNLLADAPNDASKYVRQSGTWVTITEGGTGTVQSITQGYGITASPTNPITTTGTLDVDTTTSGLSGKYLRIVDTTGKWASATASFVPYTGANFNVDLGDKQLKGEVIYAKENFYLRDTTLSGNYLVIQKDQNRGSILFANNNGLLIILTLESDARLLTKFRLLQVRFVNPVRGLLLKSILLLKTRSLLNIILFSSPFTFNSILLFNDSINRFLFLLFDTYKVF
jgi:hypothetical protein